MTRPIGLAGAAALGSALALSGVAEAQTAHRHQARHMAVVAADARGQRAATSGYGRDGRQIIVHSRTPAWLTAGPYAFPGEYNNYALWTVTPINRPVVEQTFVGMRGVDRLPNNFTVPGCCVP